ncbi:hypothetical protein G5B37_14430 [Rasiella rasia]|uniref:Tetratricopeptide repeat protein n=1 Tax=Rasiella rasia TaxID=2744027 RepID=A0A6G6GQH0_9FLAO|nr:hypothetical protein [Rasiella rasia]QIE60710.1 hypothetical protein G5B37_14430 [Rasiella rasia]
MIQSLRSNKSLLRRKGMYDKERRFLNTKKDALAFQQGKIEVEKVTEAQLIQIRKKITKQRQKELLLTAIIAVVLVAIVVFFGVKFANSEAKVKTDLKIEQETEAYNQYLYFIVDGDSWFEKRKWHNAMFQYRKALELYPNDYDAMFRLTMAISYKCEETGKDCELGSAYYKKLEAFNPTDPLLEPIALRLQRLL